MAQQRHSSEIEVTVNDSAVAQAVRRLTEAFTGLTRSAQRSMDATAQAAQQATQTATQAPTSPPNTYRDANGRLREVGTGRFVGSGEMGGAGGGGASGAGGAQEGGGVGGRALARSAALIPMLGGVARSLIQTRMARTGQATSLEAPTVELIAGGGMSGGEIGSARREGASFGFSPAETLNILRSFSQTAQMQGDLTRDTREALFQAQRMGVSTQAIGGFAGGGALGGGAVGDVQGETRTALALATYGRSIGLSGAGVERLLAQVASNTNQMAQQGLSIDTRDLTGLVASVSEAARATGDRQVQGAGAARAVQRVSGIAGGALSQFRSQFGQLGQGALLAEAARGATSPLEMLQRLEELTTSPRQAVSALSGLGGELSQLALAGGGASTAEANALLRAEGFRAQVDLSGEDARQRAIQRGLTLTRAQASIDQQLISMIEANKATSVAVLQIGANIEKLALSMTTRDALLTKAVDKLNTTLDDIVSAGGLADQVKEGASNLLKSIGL